MTPAPPREPRTPLLSRAGRWLSATQFARSVVRVGLPRDEGGRLRVIVNNLFLHLHPATIRRGGVKLSYTWCMGGISSFLFVFELVTGLLLMFYYRPTVAHAYQDVVALEAVVPMGLVREMHRWGAHLMVITVWLHMLRVFLTGSYKPPREFNWVVGVLLLVLTMLMSFTGYLLPWDQLAMWAVTVGTNMVGAVPFLEPQGAPPTWLTVSGEPLTGPPGSLRTLLLGGQTVGPATLLRFYVLHCLVLPVAMLVLMAVHFWRIRKDGGISGPL